MVSAATSLPFDPIVFLNIKTEKLTKEEIAKLRTSLATYIAEYLSIKLAKYIPKNKITELESINDPRLALAQLNKIIPNLGTIASQELENFSKDYQEFQHV